MKNILLFSFCLIALFTSNKVYSQDSYVVNTPTLNVRTEPSTKAEIIGKLASGDVVSIINSENSRTGGRFRFMEQRDLFQQSI